MIAMSKIVLGSQDHDFWTNLVKIDFRLLQSYLVFFEKDCNHIWSDWELTLQSYLVPYETEIAFILRPHCNHHCSHIWSLLWPRLQLYFVPVIKIIAIISGPALYLFTCKWLEICREKTRTPLILSWYLVWTRTWS